MTRHVTLEPSGRRFLVQGHEDILHAALSSGLALAHGCANGTCGDCRARLLSGRVRSVRFSDFVLSEADKRNGCVLLCSVSPVDDVVIEARLAHEAADIAQQSFDARVAKVVDHDEARVLSVRAPRSRVLRFFAGQHVSLALSKDLRVDAPLANCPCDGLNLEFHLPRPCAAPLQTWLDRARRGDRVRVDGPAGSFTLDEASTGPALFVAHGTAFAPIKSLIEHAINLELDTAVRLYRHAPGATQPYLHNLCRSWADGLDDFDYRWSVDGADAWPDFLRERLSEERATLRDAAVYVAGPAWFVDSTRQVLDSGAVGRAVRVSTLGGTVVQAAAS